MRDKLPAAQYRIAGIPKAFRGQYLDEIVPLNEEQRQCIEKMMDIERCNHWALAVLGTVGNGKTTLACSLLALHEYYQAWSTVYATQDGIVEDCRASFSEGGKSEAETLNRYRLAGLLVIDELNTANWTDYAKSLIQKILVYRHSNGLRTVLIGNLDPETFRAMFDDHVISRLREGLRQVMSAPDMRLQGGGF